MTYSPSNAKRLGTSAKKFGASSSANIPPNTHFRVSAAGTYTWIPRHPFPGDTSPSSVSESYSAGEVIMCDIARLTAVPNTGDMITVYAYAPQS